MLAAHGISLRVGARALVDEVSLAIAPGELVAVAGPNGAGKSSLLRLLARELPASAGRIDLNGRPLERWRAAQRARMLAVLPQASRLSFGFSAREVALFGRYPHADGMLGPEDRAIADAALALAQATHLAGRDFTTLSGGEQARVQLARVFAQLWTPHVADGRRLPRLMLLDEPTAALDLRHQHAVLAAARGFARRSGDVGILAVLHDLNLAAQYADRVILMQRGRIVAAGTPAEVLTAQRIGAVFDHEVRVLAHPDSGVPLIAAAPAADAAAWAATDAAAPGAPA